jgi:two-component system response regulator ResD
MLANVLILEDDIEIADLISLYLEREGIRTKSVPGAEEAFAALKDGAWDLVTVDLNLPGRDGFEFLEELRRSSRLPAVVISSRESDEDKLRAFSGGADDFVGKPFNPAVLAARIRAHLRRAAYDGGGGETPRNVSPAVSRGPFTLDVDGRSLSKNGKDLGLSPRELELFSFLFRNPGSVFSTRELYKNVWGQNYGDIMTVSVHIQRLRAKVEENPAAPRWIKTARGFGYRFASQEESPDDDTE